MLCSTCNKEIKEETLICPHCNAMEAVNRQQAITDRAQENHRDVIGGVFKSKHFLAYMITLIVVALAHLSLVLIEGITTISLMIAKKSFLGLGIIWTLIYAVFVFAPLRAMIASIRMYLNKDEDTFCSKTKGLISLSRFWAKTFRIVFGLIVFALFILLMACIIVLVYVNGIAKSMNVAGIAIGSGDTFFTLLVNDWITGILVFVILPLVLGGSLVLLCSKCADTYERINNYVKQMAEIKAGNSEYLQVTIADSSLWCYILGGIFALFGVVTMIWGNSLLEGLSLFGALFILNSAYLIISGIFFKHADEKVQASVLEYKRERAILDDLQKRSAGQQAEYIRQKREEKFCKEREKQAKNNETMQ